MAEDAAKTSQAALKAIRAASKGLQYQSESDKPVKGFLWKKEDLGKAATPADAAHKAADGKPVKELSVEEFFAPMTTAQPWHGDEEKEQVIRFQQLISTLKQHLADPKAFRVGKEGADPIDAYVLGTTAEGDLAGVSTQLVET